MLCGLCAICSPFIVWNFPFIILSFVVLSMNYLFLNSNGVIFTYRLKYLLKKEALGKFRE